MWSKGRIDAPNFEHTKLNVSVADFDRLKQNWHGFIRNGKLEFEKPANIEREEKESVIELIKQRAELITDKNTKEIIEEIFKLIKT